MPIDLVGDRGSACLEHQQSETEQENPVDVLFSVRNVRTLRKEEQDGR